MKTFARAGLSGVILVALAMGACTSSDRDPSPADSARPQTAAPAGPAPTQKPSLQPVVVNPTDAAPSDAGGTINVAADGAVGEVDTGAIADPGKPGLIRGPKCSGYFGFIEMGLFNQNFVIENCTAVAHSTSGGSQLYLEFGALPADVASAYASILLPVTPWQPGLYSTPLAGRIELVLKDGRRYRWQVYAQPGGTGQLSEMTLQVDTVSASPEPAPSHYIKGLLAAELRPVGASDAGGAPLRLHLQIDAPATPGPEPTLQLDCRPHLPGAIDFRAFCRLTQVNGTMPTVYCQQHGGSGGFGIRVLDPSKIVPGQPVPLAAPGSPLHIDGQFTSANSKPLLIPASATGHLLIHEIVPDKVVRGRFINATVSIGVVDASGAPSSQTCRFSETTFEALPGR